MKKYFDIKPVKKRIVYKQTRAEIYERILEEFGKEDKETMPYRIPFTREAPCLHKNCQNCHGTGHGKYGICVHMISCPCPSCSPTMLLEKSVIF